VDQKKIYEEGRQCRQKKLYKKQNILQLTVLLNFVNMNELYKYNSDF
jgi:hypothetical protein